MKIGIDARTFNRQNAGMGVERLLRNLLENWLDLYPGHEYLLISDEEMILSRKIMDSAKVRTFVRPGIRKGFLWTNITLPGVLYENKADVLLSPAYYTALLTPGIPKVVMIHDISYRVLKEEYSRKHRWVLDAMSYLSCLFADKIATISNYSKKEIEKYYRPKKGKVVCIYLGLEEGFRPAPESLQQGEAEYFLYVGTMFKRRHVQELLAAYERLIGQDDLPGLVLVGANKIHPAFDVTAQIERINAKLKSRKIVHYEHVDENKLLSLYQNCLAFYYLSSYEGFGFPPLEAMACGAPVVTVNGSSIPEVVGEAALFVDPANIDDIKRAMSTLINEKPVRDKMRVAGIKRAALFNWRRSATEYMQLLESVKKK